MKHALWAIALVIAGCDPGPTLHDVPNDTLRLERDTTSLVQTDAMAYTMSVSSAGRGVSIPFAYRNTLADTLYIVNCNGTVAPSVERLDNGTWTTIWSPIVDACLSAPIMIAPKATYSSVAQFYGAPAGSNSYPQLPAGNLDGVYRLKIYPVVLHYDARKQGFGDTISVSAKVSNAFWLSDH